MKTYSINPINNKYKTETLHIKEYFLIPEIYIMYIADYLLPT